MSGDILPTDDADHTDLKRDLPGPGRLTFIFLNTPPTPCAQGVPWAKLSLGNGPRLPFKPHSSRGNEAWLVEKEYVRQATYHKKSEPGKTPGSQQTRDSTRKNSAL